MKNDIYICIVHIGIVLPPAFQYLCDHDGNRKSIWSGLTFNMKIIDIESSSASHQTTLSTGHKINTHQYLTSSVDYLSDYA